MPSEGHGMPYPQPEEAIRAALLVEKTYQGRALRLPD
jgi:hypothetical protein